MVNEPSKEDAIAILRGIKDAYQTHHGVKIADDAVVHQLHSAMQDTALADLAVFTDHNPARKARVRADLRGRGHAGAGVNDGLAISFGACGAKYRDGLREGCV